MSEWFVTAVVVLLVAVWLGVVAFGPPFVPTLRRETEKLLDALKVGKGDIFVDLGSGDGRVLALAARRGALVHGVEINPFLVWAARLRLRGYSADIRLGDMWRHSLPAGTTHVFVFPAEMFMHKLERYCVAEARRKPGFLLVCHAFQLPGRTPEKVVGAFNLYQF